MSIFCYLRVGVHSNIFITGAIKSVYDIIKSTLWLMLRLQGTMLNRCLCLICWCCSWGIVYMHAGRCAAIVILGCFPRRWQWQRHDGDSTSMLTGYKPRVLALSIYVNYYVYYVYHRCFVEDQSFLFTIHPSVREVVKSNSTIYTVSHQDDRSATKSGIFYASLCELSPCWRR